MNKQKRILVLRVVAVVLLISVAITIFCFSAQPREKSARQSTGIVHMLFVMFYPHFNDMPALMQKQIINSFITPVRKAAHITLYFFFAAFAYLSVISYTKIKRSARIGTAFLISVLYAISDEVHQNFVAGRGPQVTDVLIDTIGILAALLLLMLIFKNEKAREFFGLEERVNAKR